jgi:inorganic triphosphatase YgiF
VFPSECSNVSGISVQVFRNTHYYRQKKVCDAIPTLRRPTAIPIVQSNLAFPLELYQKANQAITSAVTSVLWLEDKIYNQEDTKGLHAMRIAMKWLRYTLESFNPIYPDLYKDPLKNLREFQDTLGIIHDCDVWKDLLSAFSKSEKEKIINFYGNDYPFRFIIPGINYLQENRLEDRKIFYSKNIRHWMTLKNDHFRENLIKSSSSY